VNERGRGDDNDASEREIEERPLTREREGEDREMG